MKRILVFVLGGAALSVLGLLLHFFTGLTAAAPSGPATPQRPLVAKNPAKTLQLQLLRHATMLLSHDGARLLIDPMLARAGSLPPIPLTARRARNPLIELPCSQAELLASFDAVLVTHLHVDHFDEDAGRLIPKDTPILCQPSDEQALTELGFAKVQPIKDTLDWHGLHFARFDVNHGVEPWLRDALGRSSAYSISNGTTEFLLTGDTVFDDALRQLVGTRKPAHVVANSGAAQMLFGSPITLGLEGLQGLLRASPATHIHAVHMDAVNHCGSHKSDLAAFVRQNHLEGSVTVPQEGDIWEWP